MIYPTTHYNNFLKQCQIDDSKRRLTPSLSYTGQRNTPSRYIDFATNDYFGLSFDPRLVERSHLWSQHFGIGARASRLVGGTLPCHIQIEKKISSWLYQKHVLLFSTGFQLNSTVIPILTDKNWLIISDKYCHNSILQGIQLSKGYHLRFRHNDIEHLKQILQNRRNAFNHCLIILESIYSMDGDKAFIEEIIPIAHHAKALLYVDDAHAIGVCGSHGQGISSSNPKVDMAIGTFGKAFGSFGAYIRCSKIIKEYLINTCKGFIYTTALPPPILGAIDAAIEIIPNLTYERNHILQLAHYLSLSLKDQKWITSPSNPSHIFPIIIGSNKSTLRLQQYFIQHNMEVVSIRYPTVPINKSRLRITLKSYHLYSDIDRLTNTLMAYKTEPNALIANDKT